MFHFVNEILKDEVNAFVNGFRDVYIYIFTVSNNNSSLVL